MAFRFRLETEDGQPAGPAQLTSVVSNSRAGDTIPLRRGKRFRVLGVVAGEDPTLIVERVGSESDAA